jgi:hypothetical protein
MGGLYTSVNKVAKAIVGFITKPKVIASLTKNLFLQKKELD